jgi:hypothetical protein
MEQDKLYIVRGHEAYGGWFDYKENLSLEDAKTEIERLNKGNRHVGSGGHNYYAYFPAGTRMVYETN